MVSIIIPVYNVEKYLNRCIKSVLEQSYTDFELILIDDGSTDASGTICDDYKSDTRVRVVHKTNEGVSVARNYGIELSKGDYIWFVDADDWIGENALSILFKDEQSSDIIMFGAFSVTENNGESIINKRVSWNNKNEPYLVKEMFNEIFDKNVTLWNKIIKRSVIDTVRFDETMSYGEDCDFLCRIINNAKSAMIFPFELYYYYVNRMGNVVSSRIDNRSIELIDNTKKLYIYLASKSQESSAIRRIVIVSLEVLFKIPLTIKEINNHKVYIKKVRELLWSPRFASKIKFIFDRRVELNYRVMYIYLLLNPFFMFFRLAKLKIKKLVID